MLTGDNLNTVKLVSVPTAYIHTHTDTHTHTQTKTHTYIHVSHFLYNPAKHSVTTNSEVVVAVLLIDIK